MRLSVMDFAAAHGDLQSLEVAAKFDFLAIFRKYGSTRIYSKWAKFYPQGFVDKIQIAGHVFVSLPSAEFTRPVSTYIARDLWSSDATRFTIISPAGELEPVAKALVAIGKTVQFVNNVPTKGFDHEWLANLSLNRSRELTHAH